MCGLTQAFSSPVRNCCPHDSNLPGLELGDVWSTEHELWSICPYKKGVEDRSGESDLVSDKGNGCCKSQVC